MSIVDVRARVAEIQQLLGGGASEPVAGSASDARFQAALASAGALNAVLADPGSAGEGWPLGGLGDSLTPLFSTLPPGSVPPPTVATTTLAAAAPYGAAGARTLAVAEAEVGQSEVPPGSNDGPRIALYRTATQGAVAGAPWCAYFVSWAAAQAGAPLGEAGQGFGAVEDVAAWAARSGRLIAPGEQPAPGDLILFGGRHVGIVESVNPDGSLTTIEGNHASAVSRVRRSPLEATGYVRL